MVSNTGSVQRTISLPFDRVLAVERFCEKTEYKFSQAISYLVKMGLIYVQEVLPSQHEYLEGKARP